MCLKYDSEKNTLKQTCSGKCKNKCGFVIDENNEVIASSTKPKKVQIEATTSSIDRFIKTPIRISNV